MAHRGWVRLDNASNIFLAARTTADTKVFRLSAELDRVIDPALLQQALAATYERFGLYRAVLRRGVFWYYLQDSDLAPSVAAERDPTCAAIYQPDRRRLLFRVLHHHRRIVLEVFHALSDGTGAWWFLSDLVTTYVELGSAPSHEPAEPAGPSGAAAPRPDHLDSPLRPPRPEPGHGLTADSFAHYFRRRRPTASAADSGFRRAAAPAALSVDAGPTTAGGPPRVPSRTGRSRLRVLRLSGTRTPDDRTRAVELTAATPQLLALARAEGVTLTMYLTALFFEAIRRTSGGLGRGDTLAASVPVNLRQFFPSASARNFFATIRVHHTYGMSEDDLGAVCRHLDQQFRPKATPEALEIKLRKLIRFERTPVLRIVPRPLKDVILKLINAQSNRGLTVAVSNLGPVSLPEPADSRVGRVLFHVSAVRPQLSAVSHAGLLTMTFTSPFTETDHVREYVRLLTAAGVDVTVGAARVTEAELRGNAP